ncbi:McrC family protein [Gilliamella sp. wkB112]|uniref:McrC family protein n=1 Tax=Gilliamella sp. wkB112 TaxID=3120257 RepID=UPI00080D93DC|nr:hypothetical protein [Gilliamella apicola]OCG05265.1 hypothetical protein A9G12_05935 [Gilliamella apicola]
MKKITNLFEYQNKVHLDESFDELESFLDEIWQKREKCTYFNSSEDEYMESQKFIQFLHKTKEIKSNKYVGVIYCDNQKINLLPKIFFDSRLEYTVNQINQINNHILWWLSYCRKIRFPNYQTELGGTKGDFFEVLIYLFSKYTRELLNNSIYQQYEEINREVPFMKGRLNTNEYIKENLSKGNWHKLNCNYDSFELDNEFNRMIKFVATLLFNITNNVDNKKNLREILFVLDEVSDIRVSALQCSRIKFNPMFEQFEIVRDYCLLFLINSITFDYKNNLKLFAFLLPMEYLFEDFIFGFIKKEIPSISIKSQRKDVFLDEEKTFQIQPDLFLFSSNGNIIIDSKYKIIYSNSHDSKKGVSQTDLYQMLAYAIRFKVNDVYLFYPNNIINPEVNPIGTEFVISDELAYQQKIKISAYQLPIINHSILQSTNNEADTLEQIFQPIRIELIKRLDIILNKN